MFDPTQYYPDRWLASGEPYEYTARPTTASLAALLDTFRQLTSDFSPENRQDAGVYGRAQQHCEVFTDTDQDDAVSHLQTG